MKYAVITMSIGNEYKTIAEITHPFIKSYADQIDADFRIISTRSRRAPIEYEKFQILEYLDEYDRIIFFDTDIIIKSNTPNLFSVVPYGKFGAVNEVEFIQQYKSTTSLQWFRKEINRRIQMGCADFGINTKPWEFYINSGVMVCDKTHRDIFKLLKFAIGDYYPEQTFINIMLLAHNIPIKMLTSSFNHICCFNFDDRFLSHVIHYAGLNKSSIVNQIVNDLIYLNKPIKPQLKYRIK